MLLGASAGCIPVNNSFSYGDTNAFMIGGYEAGYGAGTVINDIANAIAEGIANDKSSNTRSYSSGSNNQTSPNPYLPPVIKNSLRNTPFYNVDTTYERDKYGIYGSDGIICSFVDDNEFECNNGVTYRVCGNQVCGSDGTTYWYATKTSTYACVKTSFGSTCCGPPNKKVCK